MSSVQKNLILQYVNMIDTHISDVINIENDSYG